MKQKGIISSGKMPQMPFSAPQKLLLLDTWQRSGLPARDFAASYRLLRERGLVTRLGDPELVVPSGAPDDLERAVARIRALLGRSGDAA